MSGDLELGEWAGHLAKLEEVLSLPYTNCSPVPCFQPAFQSYFLWILGCSTPEAFSELSGVKCLAFYCFLSLKDIGF